MCSLVTKTNHFRSITANALKLIERYFLDLRNTFLNQELKSTKCLKKRGNWFSLVKFSRPSCKKINLDLKNGLRISTVFLKLEIFPC